MPQMSSIISGAASLGVLAGVVSGIFYLVLTGIRWAGRVRAALQEEELRRGQDRCVSCGRVLAGSGMRPVDCTVCGRRSCFGAPCSRPAALGWTCVLCHVKREMESSSGSWTDVKSDEDGTGANSSASTVDNTTFPVREFIEKLVEKIVGGPLDSVSVGKLSNHPAYHGMFVNYHETLSQAIARLGFSIQLSKSTNGGNLEESPSVAHTTLTQIIENITREAMSLPNLSSSSQNGTDRKLPPKPKSLVDKSYEDLLSTAILNQVIEKYQKENGYGSQIVDRNKTFMRKDGNRRHADLMDDDDSDWSDESRGKPLSLKIEEQIEEVTTAYESSNESINELYDDDVPLQQNKRVPFPEFGVDLVEGSEVLNSSDADSDSCATDLISNQSTWEENWLFQKKKLRSGRNTHHPVPVPMLVPNPSQDFRALIGGRDADDISDLSECSDSVLEEALSETADDPVKVMQLIDELNREKDTLDASQAADKSENVVSDVSRESISQANGEISSTDISQNTALDSLEVDETSISLSPSPSLVQQDRDIPVDYETVHQIGRPPLPRPRNLDLASNNSTLVDCDEEEKPIVCPIAEREKAKWNNAIEMKDNPYTPESIAKRMKKRNIPYTSGGSSSETVEFPDELATVDQEPQATRKYSRDYYIKASKSPTGETSSSRFADSPVSCRSETSLEGGELLNKVQLWEDTEVNMHPMEDVLNYVTTVTYREVVGESLPKVKELRKSFQSEDKVTSKPPIPATRTKRPITPAMAPSEPSKELEIDYSQTPISQIITNLTNSTKPENVHNINKKEEILQEIAEIRGKTPTSFAENIESSHRTESISRSQSQEEQSIENENEVLGKLENVPKTKRAIKPVHSLTARSIPKDFREGLKKNLQTHNLSNKAIVGEICSANDAKVSLKVQIDLKGRKKFWEEIIANNKIS